MTNPREVERSKVLETAMQLVANAHTSIKATMHAEEELEHPLPREYFSLLREKMSQGVNVTRLIFGHADAIKKLVESIREASPHYKLVEARDINYKRMLCIDDQKLMFAQESPKGRTFFYTEEPAIIERYREYFDLYTKTP